MTATLPFIQKTFDRFNALCFGGELPPVPIVLTKAGTFLGKMEYKTRRNLFGLSSSRYDFQLKISTGFDLPAEELEDVIIHEMIHFHIAFRGIRDTSAHGRVFREIMETINRNFGRHVSVSHHGPQEQNLVRSGSRDNIICISTFPDGKVGVTVCALTKIFELYRTLPRAYRLKKMEWYGSRDPFFNRFPRARTPKIYKVAEDELSEHLKGAQPLRCDGRVLEHSR